MLNTKEIKIPGKIDPFIIKSYEEYKKKNGTKTFEQYVNDMDYIL